MPPATNGFTLQGATCSIDRIMLVARQMHVSYPKSLAVISLDYEVLVHHLYGVLLTAE
jgi:hypothetical protein